MLLVSNIYFQLASPRSSPTSKTNALKNLERHLATACSAAKDSEVKDAFLALQYTFECNSALIFVPRFLSVVR